MKVAVLPFNAAEGTKPALGRQFAAFAAEQLRAHADADINVVNFLTNIDQEGGQRVAYINLSDGMLPYEQLKDLFEQADVELVQDGYLKETDGAFELTLRYHERGNETPVREETLHFTVNEVFPTMHRLVKTLADMAHIGLPELLAGDTMEFGTDNPEVFLKFLEGFDSISYVNQANGNVAQEFSPQGAIEALTYCVETDRDFEGAYSALVQLCRICGQHQIGTYPMLDEALDKAIALEPDDFPAYFVKGELAQAVGQAEVAANAYEKAIQRQPDDAGLYIRLGIAQMGMQMPVNAERNFRRALELETDEEKPSADYLAMVLSQTNREHEIPALWKGIIEQFPSNGDALAKYAVSLVNAGKKEEGEKAFEQALDAAEDNTVVKRYYAPLLANGSDLDRAMDFYEDVLDANPTDIQTLLEYAETLEKAERGFEVPAVLKQVLEANPDPNTRAQVLARLIELEQPKRVETVESARDRMESGDFEGALRELKPLRNWLADYWKMWALMSAAFNRTEQYAEAEDATMRLLELFPGCEPAFGELVQALSGQGRAEEAFNIMQRVAQGNPQSLPIHINLGLAAARSGHSDVARNLAKQIREAVGPNEELEPVLREMES